MGSVTDHQENFPSYQNFQSEAPLHPAARNFLMEAFDRGWADPNKVHADSRKAAILLNEAKETLAGHLGIRFDQLELLANPTSGFQMGIQGLLENGSTLFYPATSRSEIYALSETRTSQKIEVGLEGQAISPLGGSGDLLCWQALNGETGIISAPPDSFPGRIFVDATAVGSPTPLPDRWQSALWNSRSWRGPAGLGIFALSDRSIWRNPLPHLDQKVGSSDFSLPLAIASALALDAHLSEYARERATLMELNLQIRRFLQEEIGEVDIAGSVADTVPYLLSFSFLYIDATRLVNELDEEGFAVDSGSACNATNMEPSHVLAAMGLLTQGNVRITLRPGLTRSTIDRFLSTLKKLVAEMRN